MSRTFGDLYNSLNTELLQITSLIKGARCVRTSDPDANAETDLLSLAEDMMEESRETLKEINKEYRKLEKKQAATSEQPKGKED